MSQYEGFFGQLAFQTSNFMGRGETLTLSVPAGSRTQNYQIAFTEPFLFDRPITAGVDISRRDIQYIGAFTQQSTGGNMVWGFPLTRLHARVRQYSYEQVMISDLNPLYTDPDVIGRNPFLPDALLLQCTPTPPTEEDPDGGQFCTPSGGPHHQQDRAEPRPQHGRQPDLPDRREAASRRRSTSPASAATSTSIKPRVRGRPVPAAHAPDVVRVPVRDRVHPGLGQHAAAADLRAPRAGRRVQRARVRPPDASARAIPRPGLVLGGNKSLLFNFEYLISIAGPVRLVLFYDAGQVRTFRQNYTWDEFKTSTGAEVRFFMPVLNVPFRLIFAANPQREGRARQRLHPDQGLPVPVRRGVDVLS